MSKTMTLKEMSERLQRLEVEVAALGADDRQANNRWRTTIGMFDDTPDIVTIQQEGAAYRKLVAENDRS